MEGRNVRFGLAFLWEQDEQDEIRSDYIVTTVFFRLQCMNETFQTRMYELSLADKSV